MGTIISNLKARFGVDTTDFKHGLKDGEKAMSDFKGAAGDEISKFAGMFGLNMQGVADSVGTASKSLGFLKQGFIAAAKGGDVLTISAKILKFALVSTGLGAIVVVLGSIAAYFMKTGSGGDKFAKILMQLKSVIDNVVQRIVAFGEGLADVFSGDFQQGWQKMKDAFKGMGEEIKNDWKASGELAEQLDKLEEKETALITTMAERKQKISELRLLAKETEGDEKKRLELLSEAERLTKELYAEQVSNAKKRVELEAKKAGQGATNQSAEILKNEEKAISLLKEKLGLLGKDITDEKLRELAELQGVVNDLLAAQADQLKAIYREKKSALAIVNEEIALEKAKAEQVGITLATISNIKMPDLNKGISTALASLSKAKQTINEGMLDITANMNDSLSTMFNSLGEAFGKLGHGADSFENFKDAILGTLASLAITVGQAAIAAGVAVLGIKIALLSLNPALAIAGGTALVALGVAMKGKLASYWDKSAGSSSASSAGGSFVYDSRSKIPDTNQNSGGTVTFKIEGTTLVGVLKNETNRRLYST